MPLLVAFALCILLVALLGVLLHYLVIRPILGTEPINQLLVTGGVLFFLQAVATLAVRRRLQEPRPVAAERDAGRHLPRRPRGSTPPATALIAMLAVWLFLKKTFLGTAIRAISQDRAIMPLMGVDANRIYLITSALGGGLAGLGACLLVLQYDVHPAIGLTFGPITFMVCVLGGLGNLIGGFIAAFIFAQFISVGGFFFQLEWGYVMAFVFFIAMMFLRPQGLLGARG